MRWGVRPREVTDEWTPAERILALGMLSIVEHEEARRFEVAAQAAAGGMVG